MVSRRNNTMDNFHIITSVVKDFPILLDQSRVPELRALKMYAVKQVKEKLEAEHKIRMTENQILQKLNTMRSKVKAKIDEISTGNKKTCLKEWESEFFDFMNGTSNSFMEVKG